MRAFWASTISFFLAFLGWFALAPLSLEVATSIGQCENQLYPPAQNPHATGVPEVQEPQDWPHLLPVWHCENLGWNGGRLQAVPADKLNGTPEEQMQYRPEVLASCVCTSGTACKGMIANAGVASVASTIFVRIALGTLLERFGPVNVQSGLLTFGAFWVAMAAAITAPWNYTLIRFFIGCAGATFVTNQFWCSLMFSANVVGTANATAAGWGNLGGGVTQIFMISVLFNPMVESGMAADMAWRVSMIVPAVLFLLCAVAMKLLCWDTPNAKHFDVAVTGQDPEAVLVGLCGSPKRCSRACDDLSVFCMFWNGAGYEQPAGNPLQDLLPNECRRCRGIGRSFWIDEPLCPLTWRNHQ